MTLHDLNTLSQPQLREVLKKCCSSTSWVKMMMTHFPAEDLVEILETAEETWYSCSEDDWKEAFSGHPEIGDVSALEEKFKSTAAWAGNEQSSVRQSSKETIEALAEGNRLYRDKFGYIFIVCATGKSAEEMLGLLHARMQNNPAEEIRIAAEEQNKITKLRLEKLLE